ncbi:MAG: cobalamin B12-binding domain-containing protein [Pseudomonadota bacterium]
MTGDQRAADFSITDRILRRLPPQSIHMLAREVLISLSGKPLPELTLEPLKADVDPGEIDALAEALIADAPEIASEHVADLFDRGLSLETVYLSHLAPAARLLGEWWDVNRVPFTDVAIAAGRIFSILRSYRNYAQDPTIKLRRAVFAAVPGEQHRIGVQMAADLFAERGWTVRVVHEMQHNSLLKELRADPSPVIGLSASGIGSLEPLIRLVIALKVARPTARLVVGGMVVTGQPRAIKRLEPDATVADMAGAEAVLTRLETLVRPST